MRKGKYDELFEIGIMKMDKPHKMLKLDSQSKYGQLIALAREAWHAYNKFIKAKTDDAYTKFQGKFEELIKDRKYRTFDYYDNEVLYLDTRLASIMQNNKKLARTIFKDLNMQGIDFNEMKSCYLSQFQEKEEKISVELAK